jgi:regulator of protease activity HflC (stomatin/prohibitin superfamily)
MEFLRGLPPWSFPVLLGFVNLLVLLFILRDDKRQVKWNRLFQLVVIDLTVLYIYVSLNGVRLPRMSAVGWLWLVLLGLLLIVLPLALYWAWLMLVSVFLLPVELKHWRQWILAARAFTSFVRGVNYPYYGYNEETNELEKQLDGSILAKTGGPGIILLRPEHAVVLHSGPKLTRVDAGDIAFTRRRERVLQLVDLRNHIVVALNVSAVTRDGIGVKLHVFVPCRIDVRGAPAQPERLYPFNQAAIIKVVCEQQDVGSGDRNAWYDLVTQRAEKAVRDVVAAYIFDRLYTAEDPNQVPRNEVRARIQERLVAEMIDSGVHIIGVGVGNIEPIELPVDIAIIDAEKEAPVNIAEQRVTSWGAEWRRRATERRARGEAEAVRILEQARAQALTELIYAVDEGFREISASGNVTHPDDVVALSFISSVEQVLSSQDLPDPLGMADPGSTIRAIRRLIALSAGKLDKG